jgi:hypothetical protein
MKLPVIFGCINPHHKPFSEGDISQYPNLIGTQMA